MVTISGKELAEAIPPGLTLRVTQVCVIEDNMAILEMESEYGPVTLPVYRSAAGTFLRRRNKKKSAPTKPDKVEEAAHDDDDETPEPPPRRAGYYAGKTRRHNGETQTLTGFTPSGSIHHKPPRTVKRVSHPETGVMVWPIWESADG